MTIPTKTEIEQVIDECFEHECEGTTKCPGMSYEEGVIAALNWVSGETDDSPIV